VTETNIPIDRFDAERDDQLPSKPLTAWLSDATRKNFDDIDNGFGCDSTLINGLLIDGKIFASPSRTSMGD
jgi:hypothetical protein